MSASNNGERFSVRFAYLLSGVFIKLTARELPRENRLQREEKRIAPDAGRTRSQASRRAVNVEARDDVVNDERGADATNRGLAEIGTL